ncbi:hypothetical protein J3R83DRAFT_299 [Lanmaoa asiatica]|nr:hypothetical protein J3R83DRAFT_299 [Lanmaoa asiatica]
MHKSIFITALSAIFLSVPVVPLPFDRALDKRSYTGRGTWFNDGLGACGYNNNPSDPIVALSTQLYGSGAECNRWVRITNRATGKTAYWHDMSAGLFEQLGTLAEGVLSISWDFM